MSPRLFRGGRGRGRGNGRGGRFGGGQRRSPAGPGGICICVNPECRYEQEHRAGEPCYKVKCPKCGSPMVRKDD